MVVAHRVEHVLFLHVVLLHHDQERLGVAQVVVGVVGVERLLRRRQQAAHLVVLHAHHLGGAIAHAALGFKRRKQHVFFGAEVVQHGRLERGVGGAGLVPRVSRYGLLGAGEQVVAVAVIVNH